MKARNALIPFLALGAALSAPLVFAQDAATAPTQDAAPAAQEAAATPANPQDADAMAAATQAAPATPATPAEPAKKITWSDLDGDKDGKLSKTETASIESLNKVFDDADADKDGALTPDEYKAYLAKSGNGAADKQG